MLRGGRGAETGPPEGVGGVVGLAAVKKGALISCEEAELWGGDNEFNTNGRNQNNHDNGLQLQYHAHLPERVVVLQHVCHAARMGDARQPICCGQRGQLPSRGAGSIEHHCGRVPQHAQHAVAVGGQPREGGPCQSYVAEPRECADVCDVLWRLLGGGGRLVGGGGVCRE